MASFDRLTSRSFPVIEKQHHTVPSGNFFFKFCLKGLAKGEMAMESFKRRNLDLEGYYVSCSFRINFSSEPQLN